MKRRIIALILGALLALSLCACGDTASDEAQGQEAQQEQEEQEKKEKEEKKPVLETAEDYLNALKDAGCGITEIKVWTEETDPNDLLGRPGNYISKADFMDVNVDPEDRVEPVDELGLPGGTIEVFNNKSDCESRYKYLNAFDDAEMGIIALKQYMYKSDNVILRVSYDLTPSQAEVYEKAFNELF